MIFAENVEVLSLFAVGVFIVSIVIIAINVLYGKLVKLLLVSIISGLISFCVMIVLMALPILHKEDVVKGRYYLMQCQLLERNKPIGLGGYTNKLKCGDVIEYVDSNEYIKLTEAYLDRKKTGNL